MGLVPPPPERPVVAAGEGRTAELTEPGLLCARSDFGGFQYDVSSLAF